MKLSDIEVLTHSSIRIRTVQGVVYFDPYQIKGSPHDGDFILITHDHFDHFSPEDIQKVSKSGTLLLVPKNMAAKAGNVAKYVGETKAVEAGEVLELEELRVEVVAAYNNNKSFHPKSAGWVGYILETEARRIYVAGDTDVTRDNLSIHCDIALVPIGGTYTMNAFEAAELVNSIRPEIAIPTHYGSVAGKKGDAEVFQREVKAPVKVEIMMQY
ncbi:MAG: MBL fold metallo-hydrolase [Lachnospiraceae bacterium]|nr:MBL fold metallo-hydrolase [Lachnospiraceae bacterium]